MKVKIYYIIISVVLIILGILLDPLNTFINNNNKIRSDNIDLPSFIFENFSQNEYSYNHKLAQNSLKIAISAFSSKESMNFWGENNNCGRESDIENMLASYGFSKLKFFDYNVSLNDYSSKCAFAIGTAKYDNDCDILAIIIRGGRYGLEWADNFNIGTENTNYHYGFYKSACKIKKQLNLLLPDYTSNKKIKIWITGYSRGGAVANILASMFDDEKSKYPCQIYAYTFASPKTAIIKHTHCHDIVYRNIFNILSPNDPIYNIPPSNWDFGRFGICVVFPDNNRSDNYLKNKILDLVYEDYRLKTGKIPITENSSINTLVNTIIKSSESRTFFYENLYGPIRDLIIVKMIKEKNEYGQWEKSIEKNTLKNMYGNEILNYINKLKNNYLFNSLGRIGIKLPEDFYIFISLCRFNGFTDYENVIFNRLNLDEISNISTIASSEFFYVGHTTEFYLSWINNVMVSDLNFIKY